MKGFFLAGWVSLIFLIFVAGGVAPSFAAESAEALYKDGKYKEAEEAFRKIDMENPKDVRSRYNRGCAAFQAGDVEGSKASFDSVLKRGQDKQILAMSAYNLGNAAFQTNDFAGAVEAYKKAIALNPADADAKYNLQLALWRKAQAEKQKQENKEGENQQEDKDSQSSKDQQGKDQNATKDQQSDQQPDQQGEKSEQGDQNQNKDQQEQTQNQENQNQDGKNQNSQQAETQQQEKAGQQEQSQTADKSSVGEEKYEQPQNLEGNLEAAGEPPPGPRKETPSQQGAVIMEQRRANALLDNVKEESFMQFQNKEKAGQGSPASGKNW